MVDSIFDGNLLLKSVNNATSDLSISRNDAKTDNFEDKGKILARIKMFGSGPNNSQGILSFETINSGLLDGPLEERMRIHENGFVGIGTDAPKNRLDVEGAMVIGEAYSGNIAAPTNGLLVEGNVGLGVAVPSEKLEVNGSVKANAFIGDGSKLTGISASQWSDAGGNIYYNKGNVGIGTMNPAARLDSAGTIRSTAQTIPASGEGLEVIYHQGSGYLTSYDRTSSLYKPLNIYGSVISLMQGKVGIGTTGPGYPLEVSRAGSTRAQVAIYSAGDVPNDLFFGSNGQKDRWSITSRESTDGNGYPLTIWRNNGSWNRVMSIDYANGNIGIGTTESKAKLHLSSLGREDGIDIDNSGWESPSRARIFFKEGGSADYGAMVGYDAGEDILYLNTLENKTEKQGIAISRYSGNVGIGITKPGKRLEVVGDVLSRQTANQGGPAATLTADNYGGNIWVNSNYDSSRPDEGWKLAVTVLKDGNVGIGTPSTFTNDRKQTAMLNVNGPIHFRPKNHDVMMTDVPKNQPWGQSYLEYFIDGQYYAVTIGASSKRFKTNIIELELDSSKIYDLRPVSFNWIANRGGKRDFGLIAEEVEKVLPLLVNYDNEGKAFSVKYDLLSVLLLNELKQKNIDIGILKEEMEQFKVKLIKLESAHS